MAGGRKARQVTFSAIMVQGLGYASSADGAVAWQAHNLGLWEQYGLMWPRQDSLAHLGDVGLPLLRPHLVLPAQVLGSLHLTTAAWRRWARKEQEHSRRGNMDQQE